MNRNHSVGNGISVMTIDAKILRTAAFGLLVAGISACGGAEADGAAAPEGESTPVARVINVEVSSLATETFQEQIRLTGVVQANRDVVVSSEEGGAIVELLVEKGAQVSVGTPLARIDSRILAAQVDQARAQAELAEETWQRRRRLWEEDRVGSELAYLQARADARQSAAALETLEQRLSRTTVIAPIDGIVDDRMVELGALVSVGTPIVRIVDVTPLKVVAGVPERYALDVRRGARGFVTFDVFQGETFEASVNFVGTTVDQQSRTFMVELTMADQRGAIKPMMIANLAVNRAAIDDAIVVPQAALVRKEDGYVVYLADGETARARAVVLGPSQQNRVVIREGLSPGDRLIVVGQQTVADGDRIRIVGEG